VGIDADPLRFLKKGRKKISLNRHLRCETQAQHNSDKLIKKIMINQQAVTISGTGSALPDEIITNAYLHECAGLTDDWILTRTGIRERRRATENETASTLGAKAALKTLESAALSAGEIDLIICTTISPDVPMPSTACLIQEIIGAKNAVCFDLAAACSGFLYGLEVAEKMVSSGAYKNALLISVDLMTRWLDYSDNNTSALFGDGAGAVLLSATVAERGILGTKLYSDGGLADLVYIGGESFSPVAADKLCRAKLRMNGKRTFKYAVSSMANAAKDLLTVLEINPSEVDLVVPHQGNRRISDAVADLLQITKEKIFCNIERVGNTTSASIPIALDECVRGGKISDGSLVLLTAFGSGATWGASVIRF
jgi:3-oxoacyl-[acyl-carrier-protein] synthase-3